MSQIDILAAQQNRLFLGSFFLNLMFVKIVLLGKLHVLQKLWITSLHAHVPLDRGFPQSVTMILSALVVSGVVLTLGHFLSRFYLKKVEYQILIATKESQLTSQTV